MQKMRALLVATALVALTAPVLAAEGGALDLDALVAPALAAGDARAGLEAARKATQLGEDATPAIAARLAQLRAKQVTGVAEAVKQAARESRGGDLLEGLVRLAPDDPEARRVAITTLILARALAGIGTTEAARRLVDIGADHGGAFRSEIARLVRDLGDRAVPALIETRKRPELRPWAYAQLEGMGKRIPADAVQSKDSQVIADVLRAYASVGDLDALAVILAFVNSDRVIVREAARESLAIYGEEARPKLREAYANVAGKPAQEKWTTAELARELFSAYDHLRLQEVYGLLDEGLAKYKEGNLDGAIADFDKVLARHPMLDRRGEMVPAYVAVARRLEDRDPTLALAALRRAKRLAPDGPRISQIDGSIAYLEGMELASRGIHDIEPFRRALALDPGHERARAEVDRLVASTHEQDARARTMAAAAVVIVLCLAGLIVFAGRRRRTRSARGPH